MYKSPCFRNIANNNALGKKNIFTRMGACGWAQSGTRVADAARPPGQQQIAQMTVTGEFVTPSPLLPPLTLLHFASATLGLIERRRTLSASNFRCYSHPFDI